MLTVGEKYTVEVVKITDKGLIVQFLNANETAFIHISKLAHEYIDDIYAFTQVGEVFETLCVPGYSKPELSIKALRKSKRTKPVNKSYAQARQPMQDSAPKPKSLEDMIASADASLRDKIGNGAIEQRKRRMGRKDNYYE